ncbi:MAG: hypothetical protein ACRC2K_06670 [Clostridium sp.]
MEILKGINEEHRELWFGSTSNFPKGIKKYSLEEKIEKEREFDSFIDEIVALLKGFKVLGKEEFSELWRRKEEELILKDGFLNINISDGAMKKGILEITKRFVLEAKNFQNDMKFEDIGQALRNVWIITILQGVFGREVKYSSAIFGYSMLYPFTDNYLDDVKVSISEKREFNNRFTKRLKGEKIVPKNNHEEKVFELVSKIEECFSRENDPLVFDSLIRIQNGQIESIDLQEGNTSPYEKDILGISIDKGGASVLVDGALIYGDLTYEELFFCIGYGFLLQLGDDLQDVKEDYQNNHTTVFSQLAFKYDLEGLSNKLINYTINLVDNAECFSSNNGEELRNLIKDNCLLLILFSVVLSKEFFNKDYIRLISEYLPFRIKYVENLKSNLRKRMKGLKGVLENPDELLNAIIKS